MSSGSTWAPARPKDFYDEGIRLSFEEWGVSGADTYLANTTGKPQLYADPANSNSYAQSCPILRSHGMKGLLRPRCRSASSRRSGSPTGSWANEAWADYRRTGYPRLMPATEDGNKSLGVVDSELGARRMPYPADEYTTNNVNVNNAVSSLLKGTDNMATRMWWDCNPAIK